MTAPTSMDSSTRLDRPEADYWGTSADTTSVIAGSSLLGSANFNPDAMTAEGLLLYLSTRLNNVDDQMDRIFDQEKAAGKVRSAVQALQQIIASLEQKTDVTAPITMTEEQYNAFKGEIDAQLNNIGIIDQNLAKTIGEHLGKEGQILADYNPAYITAEINASTDYLGMVSKDLEAGSQMNMITLQSLMGARQTAIQLATNLVSAMNESQKSIVSNIR